MQNTESANAQSQQEKSVKKSSDSQTISAGGTVTASQISDYIGLESTSAQFSVKEVYVESGDRVTEGTAVYELTEESVANAEKTLKSELKTAESELLSQNWTYTEDKNTAYALYQSELQLGDTAETTLESGISSLDSALQSAYDSYINAQDTVNNVPSEIAQKEQELSEQENNVNIYQSETDEIKESVNSAKAVYQSELENYNSIVSDYNASAGAVRYIGGYIGKDVSDVQLAGKASAMTEKDSSFSESPQQDSGFSNFSPQNGGFSENRNFSDSGGSALIQTSSLKILSSETDSVLTAEQQNIPTETQQVQQDIIQQAEQQVQQSSDLSALYESARTEYGQKKQMLAEAERSYKDAENTYNQLSQNLTETQSMLKECQNKVSSLEKEINSLNSKLSQAKGKLSKLKSEYNSLKSSYDTDKLELQNTYSENISSYENAEYHYQITLDTIEKELAEKQENYDTASENLKIFEENIADGTIYAQQDGIIDSVTYETGDSLNISMPLISYTDETSFTTLVELDQYDITEISIGDSVIIYSSETGMSSGTVTAVSAGQSTSLADVKFNVTVTAGENSNLYEGESVNVYFNSGSLSQSDFRDAENGGENSDRKMPDGFSFDNMPNFGERPDFNGDMKG